MGIGCALGKREFNMPQEKLGTVRKREFGVVHGEGLCGWDENLDAVANRGRGVKCG